MSKQTDKREKARKRKELFLLKNKRYEFSLPNKDAVAFEKRAFQKGYKPFTYLRKLIDADLHGTRFVMPTNGELVTLGRSIGDIGKNINQLTRYVHTYREITLQDVQQYQRLLQQLQTLITESLTAPQNIISLLSLHLKRYPQDRERILALLYDNQEDTD